MLSNSDESEAAIKTINKVTDSNVFWLGSGYLQRRGIVLPIAALYHSSNHHRAPDQTPDAYNCGSTGTVETGYR